MKFDLERFKEMKWIIIFFIIGDLLTTYLMISTGYGQEGNPFVAYCLQKFGFISLILLKISTIFLIYFTYPHITVKKNLWIFTKSFITFVGIFVCASNLSLFFMNKALIEYIIPFVFK